MRPTRGAFHGYEKGTYVQELSDPVIDVITEQVPRKNSPMSVLLFYRLDGAYCQVGDDETAFSGGRSPRYGVFIVGLAPDAGLLDADRGWVRGFWEALRPHAIGSGDGYINGITDFSDDRVRHSYGPAKYERLAAIKAAVRPGQPVPPQRQHPPRLTPPGASVGSGNRPDPPPSGQGTSLTPTEARGRVPSTAAPCAARTGADGRHPAGDAFRSRLPLGICARPLCGRRTCPARKRSGCLGFGLAVTRCHSGWPRPPRDIRRSARPEVSRRPSTEGTDQR